MNEWLPTALQVLGGIGLFLLGMIIMTEGLRALAGKALRAILMRFTRSPSSGAITGALTTAVLQSSSATTIAAVGFVSAGLMSFPQALGIIFGANVGTTITGWMVALLGFKFKLGSLALVLVFLGAALKLFSSGRLASIGLSVAGFGLIFVGITTMQEAMSGAQNFLTPESLPGGSLWGRVQLVLLGIAFTLITQSSSAGVATAMTALYAGAIEFEQAASLIIGMDIGTTVTAALATIGGSIETKRTGYSHVIYNIMTGIAAFMLVTPYIWLWHTVAPGQLSANPEIALVGFHSSFNFLGVVAVLPFARQFARLIERIITSAQAPQFSTTIDTAIVAHPHAALTVIHARAVEQFKALLRYIEAMVDPQGEPRHLDLRQLQLDLDRVHELLDRIEPEDRNSPDRLRLMNLMHLYDHLQRLHERCEEEQDRAITSRQSPEIERQREAFLEALRAVQQDIEQQRWGVAAHRAERIWQSLEHHAQDIRATIIEKMASGELHINEGTSRLEALRWLRRVSKHIARITYHFREETLVAGEASEDEALLRETVL